MSVTMSYTYSEIFQMDGQILTYNGFYDENLEFVGLEGVQMVASMTPGSAMGRHLLTTRFTSIVRICSIKLIILIVVNTGIIFKSMYL